MKEIRAIIQPHMLRRVIGVLHELPHFPGLTISDAIGQGRGLGTEGEYISMLEDLFFHKRKVLTVIAADDFSDRIVEAIQKSAHTGHPGDGLITVTEVTRAVRIRTGQEHNEAL